MSQEINKLLTASEVAERLNISLSNVYHNRTIPRVKIGKLVRFRESDISAIIEGKINGQ